MLLRLKAKRRRLPLTAQNDRLCSLLPGAETLPGRLSACQVASDLASHYLEFWSSSSAGNATAGAAPADGAALSRLACEPPDMPVCRYPYKRRAADRV